MQNNDEYVSVPLLEGFDKDNKLVKLGEHISINLNGDYYTGETISISKGVESDVFMCKRLDEKGDYQYSIGVSEIVSKI